MKKNILPFVFVTLFSIPALSQGWRIAPTVGFNVSAISFSSAYRNVLNSSSINTTFSPIVRWQVGALIDYSVNDHFSIRSGLLYTGKGSNLRIAVSQYSTTASVRGNIQLNYIEIPLLLNVAIGNNGFRIVGGPVFGIALNGKVTSDASTYLGSGSYNGSNTKLSIGNRLTDGMLPTELSFSLGVVKQLEAGGKPLEIGLYIQPSLSNFDPSEKLNSAYSARNLLVGLRVAYLFELRR